MSSKKKSSSSAPATPQPSNEYYYNDGVLQSQRVFDQGLNGYKTETYSTPDEQYLQNQGTAFLKQTLDGANKAFNMSDAQKQSYVDAYKAPQIAALNDSYNNALGSAVRSANASGMNNSIGFEKYRANQIEKNKAQGLADIENNAHLYGLDLPNRILTPYVTAFNLYNAGVSGEQANQAQNAEIAYNGANALNQFNLGNYGNQLNQYQLNKQNNSGGFFSKLFGG